MAVSEAGLSPVGGIHRIGPNALTRVIEALGRALPAGEVERLLGVAGLTAYLSDPPRQMVDEREVTRLHEVLRTELGIPQALRIAGEAGALTGDYLLAYRIPAGVQRLLKLLPALLASKVLMRAIQRHSWTFAGSGELRIRRSYPPRLSIAGCCICRGAKAKAPLCAFYSSAIERLFRALVHPRASVTETACQAMGSDACTFEITW
jgi:divinyl protochlorophyllide a 8-vinyl-reductase